jgi:hypothetical protein
MQATTEVPETLYRQKPERIHRPTVEEVMKYSVNVDFSRASSRPDELSQLVDEARFQLRTDENADLTAVITRVEDIIRLDTLGLRRFTQTLVGGTMEHYTRDPRACGLTGMGETYHNQQTGLLGVVMLLSRGKKGKNLLAKAGRKSRMDEKTAKAILDERNNTYVLHPEEENATYFLSDLSANRAVCETPAGIVLMQEWVYQNPEMEVLDREEHNKSPSYNGVVHLQVLDYNTGLVREVQVMTRDIHEKSKTDNYNGNHKNDLGLLANARYRARTTKN